MAGHGTTTVDFGATPVDFGVFTITDGGITIGMDVEAFVMIDSTTDNDVEAHRLAASSFRLAVPSPTSNGTATLYVDCLFGLCTGTFKIRYAYA